MPWEELEQRQWKTSHIGTYATNLAFILHECSGENNIQLLHKERVVQMCDFDIFKKKFLTDLPCDFNKMCGITDCKNEYSSSEVILFISLLITISLLICSSIFILTRVLEPKEFSRIDSYSH